MSNDVLRVAVTGCGTVVERFYVPMLAELQDGGDIDVTCVVDPSAARRELVAQRFPRASANPDLATALASEPPDVLVVASPSRFHRDDTLAGLDAGCHVLCEKPFGLSALEAEEMIARARQVDRKLSVGVFRRYYPSVRAIGSLLAAEVLGPVRGFAFSEGSIFDWPLQSSSPIARGVGGSGILADMGPHAIDLLQFWLGELELESYVDDSLGGAEVNCVVTLSTSSGVAGSVRLSRDTNLANRCVIWCDRGWVAYDSFEPDRFDWGWDGMPYSARSQLASRFGVDALWSTVSTADHVPQGEASSFRDHFHAFLASVRTGAPMLTSIDDNQRATAVIERCYEIRRPLDAAWLAEGERARWHELGVGQ